MSVRESDVLVIGSGIAGLGFALRVAPHARVAVITKKERRRSSTNYAQGGIAAVMGDDDRFELHARDTLLAGAGLCHGRAVLEMVREGPARVRELLAWGARLSDADGELELGREGGHSRRRIVHAADLTGREIERALLDALAETGNAEIFDDHVALDLRVGIDPRTRSRRCAGALVWDHRSGAVVEFRSAATLLATGGLGRAYLHTTNPDIATGDGVAMAWRAGAEMANLEFVQFHPTALYPAEERAVLVSEAVRGEGALLRTRDGEPLFPAGHRHGPLATRDVVARRIDQVLKTSGEPHVLLDLAPIPPDRREERFPGLAAACAERGIDIRADPIPVVPAAHYACGGVRTDRHGRTALAGLLAAGEVACTGVHGANRLASNSLLEALVYGQRAAATVLEDLAHACGGEAVAVEEASAPAAASAATRSYDAELQELRTVMWEEVGIVRSDARLRSAERHLVELRRSLAHDYSRTPLDLNLIELRNLADAGLLIARSALWRRESRGLHYTEDHPWRDNEHYLRDTVLVPRRV